MQTPQPTANMKHFLTHYQIETAAQEVAIKLLAQCQAQTTPRKALCVHPVPRGGVPACYAVHAAFNRLPVVVANPELYRLIVTEDPVHADVFIDDLVDSGATAARMRQLNSKASFEALFHKGTERTPLDSWLVFPWEVGQAGNDESATDIFTRLLQYVGEDPDRGGLLDTPKRMAGAWKEWTAGYHMDPVAVLRTFEDGAANYNEMVHVDSIPFYSQCEHHMAPFFGTVTFAYIPNERIVGLSKMSRLVDVFAKRLQVQERLTTQIVDCFTQHLQPKGAACVVRARHLCMESRGTCKQGQVTTTSALRGVMLEPAARAEFFSLSR